MANHSTNEILFLYVAESFSLKFATLDCSVRVAKCELALSVKLFRITLVPHTTAIGFLALDEPITLLAFFAAFAYWRWLRD